MTSASTAAGGGSPKAGATHAPGVLKLFAWTLLLSFASVLACAAIGRLAFGATYAARGVLLDAAALCLPALLALWATRSRLRSGLFLLLIAALFIVGEAAGMAMLGTPLRLSDVGALPTLLSVMSFTQKAFAGVVIVVVVAALLWLLRSPWPRWLLLAAGLAVLGSAFPHGGWGSRLATKLAPAGNLEEQPRLEAMGSFAFMLAENAARPTVGADAIARIVGNSRWSLSYTGRRRNIHLILLETFWDAEKLKGYRFSEDPFDPRFREMVDASRGSAALTPHFGHLTANAEFESLCGLPATQEGAVFVNDLHNRMPCLPRILDALGYDTQASHANSPDSWGRDRAYDLLGFRRFNSARSMRIDDTDELFLNDASFYRQNLEALDGRHRDRPVFNYLVSLSSHWPFKRNKEVRPDLISVTPADAQVSDYANAIRYSSKAFADWVDAVRARDPDALIVAYGDHAPTFPTSQSEYVASGYPINAHARLTTQQLLALAGTPLIVIDGRTGVVPVGTMPVSALPDLILKLAFGGQVELPQTRALRASAGADIMERRYLGRLLVARGGTWRTCDEGPDASDDATCRAGRRMLEEGELLRADMAEGEAHFRQAMHLPAIVTSPGERMQVTTAGCGLEIASFGPKDIQLGKGFNVQKSGQSAFWFNLKGRVGRPKLRVDDEVLDLTMNGMFASASTRYPRFVDKPGEHPLYIVCDGKPDEKIGSVFVNAPGKPAHDSHGWKDSDMRMQVDLVPRGVVASEAVRLEAWMPAEVCRESGWRGPLLVKWSAPGRQKVKLSVRNSDADPYKLWTGGGATGQSTTGEWAHDGLQIRIEDDGRLLGEFVVDSRQCRQ